MPSCLCDRDGGVEETEKERGSREGGYEQFISALETAAPIHSGKKGAIPGSGYVGKSSS